MNQGMAICAHNSEILDTRQSRYMRRPSALFAWDCQQLAQFLWQRITQPPADGDGLFAFPVDEVDVAAVGEGGGAAVGLAGSADEQVDGDAALRVMTQGLATLVLLPGLVLTLPLEEVWTDEPVLILELLLHIALFARDEQENVLGLDDKAGLPVSSPKSPVTPAPLQEPITTLAVRSRTSGAESTEAPQAWGLLSSGALADPGATRKTSIRASGHCAAQRFQIRRDP